MTLPAKPKRNISLSKNILIGCGIGGVSAIVIELGNAILVTKIIIVAAPPIPHPIKIFFCDVVLFGFAGSVIMLQ